MCFSFLISVVNIYFLLFIDLYCLLHAGLIYCCEFFAIFPVNNCFIILRCCLLQVYDNDTPTESNSDDSYSDDDSKFDENDLKSDDDADDNTPDSVAHFTRTCQGLHKHGKKADGTEASHCLSFEVVNKCFKIMQTPAFSEEVNETCIREMNRDENVRIKTVKGNMHDRYLDNLSKSMGTI